MIHLLRGIGVVLIGCVLVGVSLNQAFSAQEFAEKGASRKVIYKTIGPRKLRLDIDLPPNWKPSDQRPAIVFWSGGGFRTGNTTQFAVQARYLADRGMIAFRAEYRDLTKDNATISICLEDAASAMRWIRGHAGEYGVDPNRIVTSGGSAGGFLAAALCSVPEDLHGEKDDLTISAKPNAMVLFNPAVALRPLRNNTPRPFQDELNNLSPLKRLKKGFPPMLILIGTEDPFLEVCREFCENAKRDGARAEIEIYQGQRHAFFNKGPWKIRTLERSDKFLKEIGYLAAEPRVPLPPVPTDRRPTGNRQDRR